MIGKHSIYYIFYQESEEAEVGTKILIHLKDEDSEFADENIVKERI